MSNMKKKIVVLSVHKNTMYKRKQKELKQEALSQFKESLNDNSAVGYAFMTWNKKGRIQTACTFPNDVKDGGITGLTLPETIKTAFPDRFCEN